MKKSNLLKRIDGILQITTKKDYIAAKKGKRKIAHIHMHSIYSIADAMVKPEDVAKRAKELGIDTIILTDHGVISGIIQMKIACDKYGIKFIPACEMYEAPNGRNGNRKLKNPQSENRHITMIPVNNAGWNDMQYLIQDANMNGFHYNPRTDMPFIKEHGLGKNIIATSGCLGSQISAYLMNGQYEEAKSEILYRNEIFHTYFLEIQDNGSKDQEIVNQLLIQIAEETGIPLVYAKDVHYIMADHKKPHHTLVSVSRNQTIHECNPYPGTNTYHFASATEVYKWAYENSIPVEALENTQKIADMCNVTIELGKQLMPDYPFVEPGHTPATYLRKLLYDNLIEYVKKSESKGLKLNLREYIERIEYEYKVVTSKNVASYFLILWDLLLWSANRKKWASYPANRKWLDEVTDIKEVIRTKIDAETGEEETFTVWEPVLPNKKYEFYPSYFMGPGRGSAAGSMIAFLLDITRLDPLEYNLLFERFLNPDRKGLPDIDVDFPGDNHEMMIDYVAQRYGRDKTAQVKTFTYFKLKGTIDKVCKALATYDPADTKKTKPLTYGRAVAEEVKATIAMIVNNAGKMPDQDDVTFKDMMEVSMYPENYKRYDTALPRAIEASLAFRKMMEKYPELHDNLKEIEGAIDTSGIHAGAVIISKRPLSIDCPTIMPDEKSKAVLPITMYDYPDCEAIGLLKMDLLRTSTLKIISQALDGIREKTGVELDIYDIGRKDEKVFDYISSGQTFGLFQITGGGITGYTKQVRPTQQSELIDILALYRPGPLDAVLETGKTIAEQYVLNGNGKKLDKYLDSLPEPMAIELESSRGMMAYQENVMTIVREVAGYSRGQADGFRKVISKKKISEIKKQYDILVYGHKKAMEFAKNALAAWDTEEHVQNDKGVEGIMFYDNHAGRDIYMSLEDIQDKIKDLEKDMKLNVIPGMIEMGYPEKFADNLFRQIEAFGGYAFNKSHSACYADETYQTAWLKYYHPTEFMAALLTVRGDNKESVLDNLKEAKRMGIKILPPQINLSDLGFHPEKDGIRFGLQSIDGVGEKAVSFILEERERNGKFLSFDDFYKRIVFDFKKTDVYKSNPVNRSVIRQLIKGGSFDIFEPNRYSLLNYYNFTLRGDKVWMGKPEDLEKDTAKSNHSIMYDPKEFNEKRMLQMEYDLIGIYVTKSPYEDLPYVALSDMEAVSGWNKTPDYDIGGRITKIKPIKIKNGKNKGKDMAHIFIETQFDNYRITAFVDEYDEYGQHFYVDNILVFRVYKKMGNYNGGVTEDLILSKVLVKQAKKLKKEMGIKEKEYIASSTTEDALPIIMQVESEPAPKVRPDPVADLFDDTPAKRRKKKRESVMHESFGI